MRNLHHSHHHVERHLDSSPVEWEPQAVNGEELALDKRDPQVATQVSIVYVTASKTFAGPVGGYTTMLPSGYSVNHGTLSAPSPEQPTPNPEPSTQVQPSSTKPKHTDQNSKPPQSISFPQSTAQTPTTAPSSSNTQASSTLTSSSVATISPQSSAPTGSYSVASDQPPSLQAAASGSDVTAPAASSSPSAVTKNSDGGMSGGAKAGLAIGIIFIIALIAGGAFLLFRRKKRQEESHERIEDNEKVTAPSGMVQAERAPSARSARTASTAPRLSLPALTQFSANLNGEQRPTVGNKLEMTSRPIQAETAAFVAPAAQQTKSMWERPGERGNATESVNPFGDHAASVAAPVGAAVVGAAAGAVTARKVNDRRRSSDVVPKPLSIKSNHSQTSLASSAAHSAVSDGAPSSTNDSEFQVGTASTASSAIPAAVGAAAIPASLSPPAGPPSNVHRVQMEFKPSMEDELELRPGQIVRILHEYDDGWVSTLSYNMPPVDAIRNLATLLRKPCASSRFLIASTGGYS